VVGICQGTFPMAQKSILADTPENLIKKYRLVLAEAGIPVDKIILFGSYAKGTSKSWSDVDICVVSPLFGKNGYDERVRLMKLASGIDDMIEPHPYNAKDLADPWDPLAYEIRTNGRVII